MVSPQWLYSNTKTVSTVFQGLQKQVSESKKKVFPQWFYGEK